MADTLTEAPTSTAPVAMGLPEAGTPIATTGPMAETVPGTSQIPPIFTETAPQAPVTASSPEISASVATAGMPTAAPGEMPAASADPNVAPIASPALEPTQPTVTEALAQSEGVSIPGAAAPDTAPKRNMWNPLNWFKKG